MTRACKGCQADLEIDATRGQVANFTDDELVVWQCPDCEYPHVDNVSQA